MAKGFFRYDKIRVLEMENYTGLSGWGQRDQKGIYKRKRKASSSELEEEIRGRKQRLE